MSRPEQTFTEVQHEAEGKFSKVPEWVLMHPGLSASEKCLYAAYALFGWTDGVEAFPSDAVLMQITGATSTASLRGWRARLAKVGAIAVEQQWNRESNARLRTRVFVKKKPPADPAYNPPRSGGRATPPTPVAVTTPTEQGVVATTGDPVVETTALDDGVVGTTGGDPVVVTTGPRCVDNTPCCPERDIEERTKSNRNKEQEKTTPPVEHASVPDRRSGDDAEVGTVGQLFDCGGLTGKIADRVAIDHEGETLWFDTPADAVYGLWRILNGKRVTAVFSEKRRGRVEDCLAVLGLRRCLDAVRGNTVSEFHQGDNDRGGRRFDDLAMIFASVDDAERFERYWTDPASRANGYSRRAQNGRVARSSLAAPLPTAADFGADEDAEKDMVRNAYRSGYEEARRNQPDASDVAWQEHGKAKARELREKLRAGKCVPA